jgi:hypothetical protein
MMIWIVSVSYLKGAHEEGGVGGFGVVIVGVMVDFIFFVVGMGDEFFEFGDVLPGFAKIEGAEIHVKGFILEILNGEWFTLSMLK